MTANKKRLEKANIISWKREYHLEQIKRRLEDNIVSPITAERNESMQIIPGHNTSKQNNQV